MVEMRKWLKLLVFLHLMIMVRGKDVQCDNVGFNSICWKADTLDRKKNCSYCDIHHQQTSISDDVFIISDKLLNGSYINIELIKLKDGSITKMPQLLLNSTNQEILQVYLDATNTKVLNERFFEHSKNLTSFKSTKSYELSVEDLAFQMCKRLEHLSLIDNNLQAIPSDAFFGLTKLVYMDLTDNKLNVVDPEWFQSLGNLEKLDLSLNVLKKIPEEAFNVLTKLKELNLGNNKIETIQRTVFAKNEQLEIISLFFNQIKEIKIGSFEHLNKLVWLDLSRNQCINIEFKNKTPTETAEGLIPCYPTRCFIPKITNGYIVSIQDYRKQIVGNFSKVFSFVQVFCNANFVLIHENSSKFINQCLDMDWENTNWPTCQGEEQISFLL